MHCPTQESGAQSYKIHGRGRQDKLPRQGCNTNSRNAGCQDALQQRNFNQRSPVYDNGHLQIYLRTPLHRPEFIRMKLSNIPDKIIDEYKLQDKTIPSGSIYIVANCGMYGLPQSGLIANKLLEKRLNEHGYQQSKLVPGLW